MDKLYDLLFTLGFKVDKASDFITTEFILFKNDYYYLFIIDHNLGIFKFQKIIPSKYSIDIFNDKDVDNVINLLYSNFHLELRELSLRKNYN